MVEPYAMHSNAQLRAPLKSLEHCGNLVPRHIRGASIRPVLFQWRTNLNVASLALMFPGHRDLFLPDKMWGSLEIVKVFSILLASLSYF